MAINKIHRKVQVFLVVFDGPETKAFLFEKQTYRVAAEQKLACQFKRF